MADDDDSKNISKGNSDDLETVEYQSAQSRAIASRATTEAEELKAKAELESARSKELEKQRKDNERTKRLLASAEMKADAKSELDTIENEAEARKMQREAGRAELDKNPITAYILGRVAPTEAQREAKKKEEISKVAAQTAKQMLMNKQLEGAIKLQETRNKGALTAQRTARTRQIEAQIQKTNLQMQDRQMELAQRSSGPDLLSSSPSQPSPLMGGSGYGGYGGGGSTGAIHISQPAPRHDAPQTQAPAQQAQPQAASPIERLQVQQHTNTSASGGDAWANLAGKSNGFGTKQEPRGGDPWANLSAQPHGPSKGYSGGGFENLSRGRPQGSGLDLLASKGNRETMTGGGGFEGLSASGGGFANLASKPARFENSFKGGTLGQAVGDGWNKLMRKR